MSEDRHDEQLRNGTILDRAEVTLARLADSIHRDQLDEANYHMGILSQLLAEAQHLPAETIRACTDQIVRLREEHRRVQLGLAEMRSELGRQRQQLRDGKQIVRAYGQHN